VRVARVPFRPDLIDVESGLESGELVALSGVGDLREGATVRVSEREASWNE
jgi:hypothetical protein